MEIELPFNYIVSCSYDFTTEISITLTDWLKDNCQGQYSFIPKFENYLIWYVNFEIDSDAVLFKLAIPFAKVEF